MFELVLSGVDTPELTSGVQGWEGLKERLRKRRGGSPRQHITRKQSTLNAIRTFVVDSLPPGSPPTLPPLQSKLWDFFAIYAHEVR